MKKINVGIVGYGNLGKALENILLTDKRFNLVAVFSRREINTIAKFENYKNLNQYIGEIDILFLCGGSSSNLPEQIDSCLRNFNTIDAYDVHAKIPNHIKKCQDLCLSNSKIAFCCFGWDPGLFSLMRLIIDSIEKNQYTSWGKGVSQGHTEAIKRIDGVVDAIQYTIPDKELIEKIKHGEKINTNLHHRECFVLANKNYSEIAQKIKDMPFYFKGYKTNVHFVDKNELEKRKKAYHAGEVFCLNDTLSFKLKTENNAMITAKILVAFSIAEYELILNKKYGVYTILDMPLNLLNKNYLNFI